MALVDVALLVFFVPVALLWARVGSRGRRWAGAWLLTIAPLYMPLAEDGFLATWYAIATPAMDPDALRGIVNSHALGHVFGAGVAAILLGILASWIAHRPLRRGEAWAWKALLVIGVPVMLVGVVELALYYPHGLPFSDHDGFGWPIWAAGLLAWGSGLWLARPGADASGA